MRPARDGVEDVRRRQFQRWIVVSAIAHGILGAALIWAPSPQPAQMPGVITVDLVAMAAPPAAGKPASLPKPLPRPAQPKPPAPVPAKVEPVPPAPPVAEIPKPAPARAEVPKPEPPKPEPPKPPPPPPPKAETVIPKTPQREPEKPKATPEPEPKPEPPAPPPPKVVAKVEPPKPAPPKAEAPKPPPAAKPAPPPKPQEESYDDLLADLRAERGETRPDRVERPVRTATAPNPGAGGTAPTPGARASGTTAVSPEIASWLRAARLHVRQAWVLPAGLRSEPLETQVEVQLDAQGNVLAEPKVIRRSGNPWYDESVVRAIQKASPLPPPPEPGAWPFVFKPEDLG